MKVYLSLAILTLALAAAAQAWEQPEFCKENECPEFNVVEEKEDYEVRDYVATKWVVTDYKASNMLSRFWKMNTAFMRLFQYIDGSNVNATKVKMTAPVRVVEYNCKVEDCTSRTHVMGFYVPQDHADNPPQPLTDDVQIIEVPAKRYYVTSYPGYATEWSNKRALRKLKQAIGDEAAYDTSFYVTAGYNSPMEMRDRHNEVMLAAADN